MVLIADRLARTGGACDQKMRHAREIDDHRLAADGLAEASGSFDGVLAEIFRFQQFAQTTFSRFAFGSSMPMALRPGRPRRAPTALIERAISSARPITREDLMPGAGSSSYSVTTGPGRLH
jgi:hypothetical protein